jgi:hypothetical protein
MNEEDKKRLLQLFKEDEEFRKKIINTLLSDGGFELSILQNVMNTKLSDIGINIPGTIYEAICHRKEFYNRTEK